MVHEFSSMFVCLIIISKDEQLKFIKQDNSLVKVEDNKKMPRRFVRESKFRHVFGEAHKKTKCYDNIDITKNTWDGGSYCDVNSKFIAVVLERCCFIVIPTEKVSMIFFFVLLQIALSKLVFSL